MDLSNYVLVGRYDLPTPSNSTAPANSELAAEASAVTYNWDTDSLFIVGDEGTSIVQVSKTGQLIDSMTLPQGVAALEDPEGLTYVGGGKFVLVEERTRTAVQFTYTPGGTLTGQDVQKVVLGTNAGNLGLEGIAYDPFTGGFIFVKENTPQGVFQSTLDFTTNTASNGSATTENSTNLFDPATLGLVDIADVFALSALPATDGTADEDNILILSQESGRILEVNRADGSIVSSLTITPPVGSSLGVVDQGHEGLTMDRDGNLYVVNEQGGGTDTPQLWVYALADFPNAAPTAIALANEVAQIAENANTSSRIKVADVVVTDDGIGTNVLSLSGADAAFFEVDSSGLYIKAGTVLDYETKASYAVTVEVDDTSLGNTPDASTNFTLSLTDVVNENGAQAAFISEVSPWSSGNKNSPIGQDWFELTNTSDTALNISGWSFDDDSASFAEADPLLGITTIAAGESVIFLNTKTLETTRDAFINTWFGGTAPAGLQFGTYDGAGLGTEGDGIYLFDQNGTVQTSLLFGTSPTSPAFATFDNSAALEGVKVTTLSQDGVGGAYTVTNTLKNTETGSPGTVGKVFISEVAPWSSGGSNSPVGEDWFELTNTTAVTIDITGWRFDDDSKSFAESDPLLGVTSLAPGESVIFLNSSDLAATRTKFVDTWFGGTAPAGLQFGSYEGAGLGTGGDAIYLFDAAGNVQTGVTFGASTGAPALATFDNASGREFAAITSTSTPGNNGAFQVSNMLGNTETGSPGSIVTVALPENLAPTAVTLKNSVSQIEENTGTPIRIKLADVAVTDDGQGFNTLSLAGADAGFFEVDSSGLYLKAGTQLDYEAKTSYSVTVQVDDTTVGTTPDASTSYTLNVTNQVIETGPALIISEVAPWSSGKNTPVGEDWFELTNVSNATVDISGWRFDDDSASLAESDPLLGVTTIAPGESIIFLNTKDLATVQTKFVDTWFGGTAPAGVRFGNYEGAGLGTGGDAIYLFDNKGTIKASVTFGASTEGPFATFDNSAGLNHTKISTLAQVGVNGAFAAPNDTDAVGSPGTIRPANDAPIVGNDSASVAKNGTVRIDVLANDYDTDGDALSIVSLGRAANGTVSVNSDGSLAYTAKKNFVGTDSFRYTVSDGEGGESTATVTIKVNNSGGGLFNLSETHIGDEGRDVLFSLFGDNFIDGRGGNDTLTGGIGNDVILGGAGNDTLNGLLGNDVLTGGTGRDVMTGGAGNDRYVFDDGDTGATVATADRITDTFSRDIIDLSLVDAIAGGGDDAFRFIGRSAFSGNAGELRYQTVGGSTYVVGDTNGDASADLMIILTGQIQLSSNNFVF